MTYVNQKEGQSRLTKTSCFHTIALIARNSTLFIEIEEKNICTHPLISTTLDRNSLSVYDANFFINLLGRAFREMKNGVYFIVIAVLVAKLFKIIVYAN